MDEIKKPLLIAVGLLNLSCMSWAGREPELWDHLPQISDIKFSPASIGLISNQSKFFVLDRKSGLLSETSADMFSKEPWKKTPDARTQSGNESLTLRSSSGEEYESTLAYCGEGENGQHRLTKAGTLIEDGLKPCDNVASLERAGNDLWLGTSFFGEYGAYPSDGVFVKTIGKGKIKAHLQDGKSLTGNLINAIRLDPQTGHVWIATNQGLDEIGQDFKPISHHYFYQDFDPNSKRPTFLLSTVQKESNPLAILGSRLPLKDPVSYYNAVGNLTLTQDTARCLEPHYACGQNNHILPKEMNVLVPFLIDAADSTDRNMSWFGKSLLCAFDDPRAKAACGQ